MTELPDAVVRLGPELLDRLPVGVARPGYDRRRLEPGMAHVGVGAFHRCHQAEYTDDMLAARFGRWGVIGVNVRPPELGPTLGAQGGLYTRLIRSGDRVEARVIGSIVRVVDSQAVPETALRLLAAPEIDVITLTVTEKGYCHRPATGALDLAHPDVEHDLARPDAPRSVPGLVLRALERRMATHGRPVTVMSCDNIPSNGTVLGGLVQALAAERGPALADWIAANAAFPSSMVDRIAPATTAEDLAAAQAICGFRDAATVVGEPFRQWVIEDGFAGRRPDWDLAGADFVDDVTPFEHLKMRVLNGAQSALAYLGVLAGHDYTWQAARDPLLADFVRRMLLSETLPTLTPVPGVAPKDYLETSLARLRNTAIRHRIHQVATDGSQKIVQRLVNPAAERMRAGAPAPLLTAAIAAWMAYLVRASGRFGRQWTPDDPQAGAVAAIADRVGRDPEGLVTGILAIDSVFAPELAGRTEFRAGLAAALDGLLGDAPMDLIGGLLEGASAGR